MSTDAVETPQVICDEVEFASGADRCRGWLYRPARENGPLPVVVLAHGLGATHVLHYWRAAEAFAAAGYAVLDFDPRHVGLSGGDPRQALSYAKAVDDLRAAVTYVRSRMDVCDPDRVVLYGSSIGGGMAIDVASADPRLAALVLVVPMVDALTNLPGLTIKERNRLMSAAIDDRIRAACGRERRLLVLFGDDDDREAVIHRDDAGEVMREEMAPGGAWSGRTYTHATAGSFRNEIAAWELLKMSFVRPVRRLRKVTCPILMIVGKGDRVTPAKAQRNAGRKVGAQIVELPTNHFGPFRSAHFADAFQHARAFLEQHVPVGGTERNQERQGPVAR